MTDVLQARLVSQEKRTCLHCEKPGTWLMRRPAPVCSFFGCFRVCGCSIGIDNRSALEVSLQVHQTSIRSTHSFSRCLCRALLQRNISFVRSVNKSWDNFLRFQGRRLNLTCEHRSFLNFQSTGPITSFNSWLMHTLCFHYNDKTRDAT